MTTRFSKQKLAEAQGKKAKGGLVIGILSKKHSKIGDVSKDDPVVTPPSAHSPAKRPASPTSSLEVIASAGEETKKKKKIGGKPFLPSFWDDADVTALKAQALSVDDLNLLMAKSSSQVMSSHIQKLMQTIGESLFISGKLLDLEKKVSTAKPMVKSLSTENETLKNKVAILAVEAENEKRTRGGLEEESSSGEGLLKWMTKHHPDLDFSGLVIGDVKKELLSDHPSKATAENVMEEATTVAVVIEEAAPIVPADPTLEE
nr:hypothetical protein CFP56_47454 [Quercus suber]